MFWSCSCWKALKCVPPALSCACVIFLGTKRGLYHTFMRKSILISVIHSVKSLFSVATHAMPAWAQEPPVAAWASVVVSFLDTVPTW